MSKDNLPSPTFVIKCQMPGDEEWEQHVLSAMLAHRNQTRDAEHPFGHADFYVHVNGGPQA